MVRVMQVNGRQYLEYLLPLSTVEYDKIALMLLVFCVIDSEFFM
jgi:hypothetical protein